MKRLLPALQVHFVFLFAILCVRVFADVLDPVPVSDFWAELLKFVGGVSGASAMALAAGVAQLVMLFFKTPLADFAGKWKLAIVAGVNVLVVLLSGLVSGAPLMNILFSQALFVAVQIAINEVIKHVKEA